MSCPWPALGWPHWRDSFIRGCSGGPQGRRRIAMLGLAIAVVYAIHSNPVRGSADTSAAAKHIIVGPAVLISSDEPDSLHVESVVAVNPRDSQNVIAAVITFGRQRSGVAVYFTRDGGKRWARATSGTVPFLSPGLDPDVAFDAAGHAYLVSLADQGLAVWSSGDGGARWTGPTWVPGSWDRPWIIVDPVGLVRIAGKLPIKVIGSPAQDVLAITTSRDGGRSFDFPALMLPPPQTHVLNALSSFELLPDGKVLLMLQVFAPDQVRHEGRLVLVGHYDTLDLTAEEGSRIRRGPEFHTYGHGWEGKSAFGYGVAHIAVDRSGGSRHGRIYTTYLDLVDGFYRVMASTSVDGGATWTPPVTVSDAKTATDASNPAIAVDGNGSVGVVWNDRSGDPTDRCYRPFFAASFDGGVTFSPGQAISDSPACPVGRSIPGHLETDPVESTERFKNGGDTQGIAGIGQGFEVAWIGGPGELALWSTRIELAAPRSSSRPEWRLPRV